MYLETTWGADGAPDASPYLKDLIEKAAPAMFANMMAMACQETIRRTMSNL